VLVVLLGHLCLTVLLDSLHLVQMDDLVLLLFLVVDLKWRLFFNLNLSIDIIECAKCLLVLQREPASAVVEHCHIASSGCRVANVRYTPVVLALRIQFFEIAFRSRLDEGLVV
jgi:hypothetical protein